jgi:hypothetical protein
VLRPAGGVTTVAIRVATQARSRIISTLWVKTAGYQPAAAKKSDRTRRTCGRVAASVMVIRE